MQTVIDVMELSDIKIGEQIRGIVHDPMADRTDVFAGFTFIHTTRVQELTEGETDYGQTLFVRTKNNPYWVIETPRPDEIIAILDEGPNEPL